MASKKVRVYELARELGVENSVIIDLSSELKIGVKSHSSSIDDPSADRVRRLADSKGLRRDPIVEVKPEPKKAAPKKTVVSSSSRKRISMTKSVYPIQMQMKLRRQSKVKSFVLPVQLQSE